MRNGLEGGGMLENISIKFVTIFTIAVAALGLFSMSSSLAVNEIKFTMSNEATKISCRFKVVRHECIDAFGTVCFHHQTKTYNWSAPVKAGGTYFKDGKSLRAVIVSCFPSEKNSAIQSTERICIKAPQTTSFNITVQNYRIRFNGNLPESYNSCSY